MNWLDESIRQVHWTNRTPGASIRASMRSIANADWIIWTSHGVGCNSWEVSWDKHRPDESTYWMRRLLWKEKMESTPNSVLIEKITFMQSISASNRSRPIDWMRFRGLDSGDWVTIKDLKESYPVPLANYAVANNLQTEPAFIRKCEAPREL